MASRDHYALSRFQPVFVAWNSSFTYRPSSKCEAGRARAGVRYVLEGSVCKAAHRAHHRTAGGSIKWRAIWADRFDGTRQYFRSPDRLRASCAISPKMNKPISSVPGASRPKVPSPTTISCADGDYIGTAESPPTQLCGCSLGPSN